MATWISKASPIKWRFLGQKKPPVRWLSRALEYNLDLAKSMTAILSLVLVSQGKSSELSL